MNLRRSFAPPNRNASQAWREIALGGFAVAASWPSSALAQSPIFRPPGTQPPIALPNLSTIFTNDFANTLFQKSVEFIAIAGAILAAFYVAYGGYRYVISLGDPAAATEGRKMIIGGVVGLLMMAFAYLLIVYARSVLISDVLIP